MTEVRIRHEFVEVGAVLADVPFDELDTVLPALRYNGLNVLGSAEMPEFGDYSAGFVYDPELGEAFFEIIVHPKDET